MSLFPSPSQDFSFPDPEDECAPDDSAELLHLSNAEVKKQSDHAIPWLWRGFVAADAVTLVTAPSKEGKSTLLALLLDRLRAGGTLLGQPVRAGKALVCSEDNKLLWALRQQRLDFGPQVDFCEPDPGVASRGRWARYIEHVADFVEEHGFDLVAIDPIARFIPGIADHAACLARALARLRMVASDRTGLLLMHHPPCHRVRAGQMVHDRFLAAFADILIDMRKPPGDPFTRRRRFLGTGRYPGTPQRVLAELNAEETDYAVLADDQPEEALIFSALCALLRASPTPLTRDEILARWPAEPAPPTANTLWRWLTRGLEMGVLVREGVGNKKEPYRYRVA